eukprot:TRINITY_DN2336_c0_g1_i1.p1 TRINITY_DN2336_c0_g1~~TRINITY_DN2336_c0_g1_i1.p1  ORF type:complete len:240 (+),score=64.93 TRINITY_DN2336_c0_g1_i1:50-769(+)
MHSKHFWLPGGNSHGSARFAVTSGVGSLGSAAPSGKTFKFPMRAALTAGGLALTGDSIAQLVERKKRRKNAETIVKPCCRKKELAAAEWWRHDVIRSLRMFSYGFLIYGPGSQLWYEFLDRHLAAKNLMNFSLKVIANQVILGPAVVFAVFTWNFGWQGRVKELPAKYQQDFIPTMMAGWKFWIPVALINFSVVPLQGRVPFMSAASVFWNFYLSTTVGKQSPNLPELQCRQHNVAKAE